MIRLLVIDDDYSLFALLAEYLGNAGFDCHHAADGDAGVAALTSGPWDAVILDIMLPGKNGHEVLEMIRSKPEICRLPVLMLTARGEEDDKVKGLELGADDYLSKPFGPKELVARLHALLRRSSHIVSNTEAEVIQLDDLRIEKSALMLVRDGYRIELTASELRLIELFADSIGKVIGRDTLYREILGHPPFAQDRSLDMMMSRLRKKLGPRRDGRERIRAARGQGYMFLLTGDE
ncbi:MAG: response regulator transcription factor [Planctomycetaceae bacterium]|nr:response regulator transcription factor [Planctomycetaceae bacterium]